MSLHFFDAAVATHVVTEKPSEMYRDLNQAFIAEQWDNTTAVKIIEEQDIVAPGDGTSLDSFTFHKEEAWVGPVVGQSSTGLKNGDDFLQLLFKSIEHPCIKGRYYRFDGNYWLTYFTNEYTDVAKGLSVRRCNNWLKIRDPMSGSLYSVPCVVGYEASSPSPQVSRYIITPNNHLTVIVQGNGDTNRLFRLNTRYIIGKRPFKLVGFQNAICEATEEEIPALLYLTLFLDEEHPGDDIEHDIADNGEYSYRLRIDSSDMSLISGATGTLGADVTLNGVETQRQVEWNSSNPEVASIDANGRYEVRGEVGQSCVITSSLRDNPAVKDSVVVKVVTDESLAPCIIMEPTYTRIRQYETIDIELQATYGGKLYSPLETSLTVNSEDAKYLTVHKTGNKYKITAEAIADHAITLTANVKNDVPEFQAASTFTLDAVSMMG